MSEKFLPRQEAGRDPNITEWGTEILNHANTPRELIVTMRNWILMREDLRTGKYVEEAARVSGVNVEKNYNPYAVLDHLAKIGKEKLGLGLEMVLGAGIDAQRQSDTALTNLIDLAWQKFSTSNPSPEEVALFKEQVPQLADRSDSLKKDD